MPTKIWMRLFVVVALVMGLAFAGLVAASNLGTVSNVIAQSASSGEWTASLVDDNSKIHLNFQRRTEKSGKHQIGQNYDFSDLQGLTREQASNGGPVKFKLVREAGTIECEGSFQDGKGSGTFRFTGSQAFVSAMKSRGFDFEKGADDERNSEDRLFTAAALNITTALADDLSSAGFGKLQVSDLFKAAIFKIDSTFMREMKASGFPNLDMEDLVKARIFKIDAKFVTEATQMGFAKEPFESLVKMRIFKITPEYIAEVRNEGLTNLS
ncbi:MAG TPA: hypothetical protein VIG25_18695, partial [Pyrinomonadaceae bacterium]